MRASPFVCSALFLAVFAAARAEAQVTADQAETVADTQKSNLPPDTFGGELMFGKFDEDYFISLALRLNFDRENFGFGVQLPVRFRVIDRDPQMTNDIGGMIRREDWDEPSDFLRIIRYVYVGQADKKGPYYVRVGELSGLTIGHGTIMYRYYNGVDQNVWRTGLNTAVNIGAFGAEAMTGDVVNPYILGARFQVRPLELAMGEGMFWEKWHAGISFIGDARAPYNLDTAFDPDTMEPISVALDEHKHPIVLSRRPLGIFGIDTGIDLVANELFSVTPYIDLNKMGRVDYGWGLHMGVLWGLRLPLLIDTLVIDARTEYRRVSGDYIGPYFNTSYEIERFQTFDRRYPFTPKLHALIENAGDSRNGVFFDLLAGLPEFVFVGGEYIDYDGGEADGTLRLSLEIPALEVVKFSGFYYRVGIRGGEDLFKIDDRSAIVAQAAIPLYAIFDLRLRLIRTWQADPTDAGQFNAVDDISFGFGFNLTF